MLSKEGYISHLYIKPEHKSIMKEVEEFSLKEGHGIEGDVNANPISPRQLLVVRCEDISELGIPPGELRENIVIAGIQPKNFVPGSLISFDNGAAIRLTFHCEPCKRIAHLVDSLKILHAKRGILGVVINSGTICIGDNVHIETNKFSALSENPYERFLNFILKVPAGKVVTYKQIIQAIGVDNSYLRAIPIYLKKTSADDYPIHRILDSQGYLTKYVSNQKNELELEGIQILIDSDLSNSSIKNFIDYSKYLYQNNELYLN
ncbi:MGMT family protein [Anabaena sp. UHCC 0399]|uniref:MGMT family protein n=1 Tax=Anabaena sp. UHCC 0399 TaxID=3110238 RepID=UPI002B1F8894|nr:MGMT family protein [Anabaena sp. UHCC 0399]MEA5569252.1 MGMT family protein [Anabaena sp. UHCC 0399]